MKLRNKKTGEIIDAGCRTTLNGNFWITRNGGGKPIYMNFYESLADLNEEWEDYKPTEPLIKDEKIRKAVRAWAEANSIEEVLYAERTDRSLFCLTDMGDDDYAIEFVGWIPTLKDGGDYTIDELCGEEEE